MFYIYRQTNSGGYFKVDFQKGIAKYVIVESDSIEESIRRAESIGLYFDGDGDCSCCGNRWRAPYEEGKSAPEIYGDTVTINENITMLHDCDSAERDCEHINGFVHYKNGNIKTFYYK